VAWGKEQERSEVPSCQSAQKTFEDVCGAQEGKQRSTRGRRADSSLLSFGCFEEERSWGWRARSKGKASTAGCGEPQKVAHAKL